MIWDHWRKDDDRLGDWKIVGRHRKRAYKEGFTEGLMTGGLIGVLVWGLFVWIKG